MSKELTGPALDRAACEALGITPSFEADMYGLESLEHLWTRRAVYPRVSTYEGVKLLVERLEAMGLNWERTAGGYSKIYDSTDACLGLALEYGEFPEALARAVVEWGRK